MSTLEKPKPPISSDFQMEKHKSATDQNQELVSLILEFNFLLIFNLKGK